MALKPTIKSPGTTHTEKQLSELCDSTFLKLWSYPNLYTDEGLSKNKQGKELCDLLCVFGNDVIIFSDKSISFSDADISVAWPRWYRKAIKSSAKQIQGAEKWIKEQKDRIFLDKKCTQKFPLPIDHNRMINFHRIVVARNSKEAAEKHFGGSSSGSLIIRPTLTGDEHFSAPFHIGRIIEDGPYAHVLDDTTLDLVLRELDTATDFISYLTVKEKFIASGQLISAAGEEEILAQYLSMQQGVEAPKNLIPSNFRRAGKTSTILAEGLWQEFSNSYSFAAEKIFAKNSYIWDEILQRIGDHILVGDAVGSSNITDHEKVLRLFADENRRSRIILGHQVYEKYNQVPPGARSARVVPSPSNPKKAFILLFFPRGADEDYQSYRDARQGAAIAYAHTLKLMQPRFRYICTISTEPRESIGRSEEFMAFDIPELSEEEKIKIKSIQKEFEIFTDLLIPPPEKESKKTSKNHRSRHQRPKRNSLCPCGSGLKFKFCCGNSST